MIVEHVPQRWRGPTTIRILIAAAVVVTAAGVWIAARTGHATTHRSAVPADAAATTVPARATGAYGSFGDVPSAPQASVAGGSAAGAPATAGAGTSAAAGAAPAAPVPLVGTKVVKTATLSIEVPHGRIASSIDQLTALAVSLGGYPASTASADNSGAPAGDLTLRVPVDKFETLLSKVKGTGVVTALSTTGQDVTANYVDMQARITALQASHERYLAILAHANTIGDILAVQQQIDGVQAQLDQVQGQFTLLSDQTSFGTVTIHLAEPAAVGHPSKPPAKPSGVSKAWEHARRSFARGLESVLSASGGFAVFALCVLVLGLAARTAWMVSRRVRRSPSRSDP